MPSKLKTSDVLVVVGARFLSKFMPVWILGTFLAICMVIYAIAWILK